MKSQIDEKLDKLKEEDVYSLILYILFQLKNNPNYAILSELTYVIDKQSMVNLLNYFGGMIIKIPTLEELKLVINALCVYEYINVENLSIDDAINKLELGNNNLEQDVKNTYFQIIKIIEEDYNFNHGKEI